MQCEFSSYDTMEEFRELYRIIGKPIGMWIIRVEKWYTRAIDVLVPSEMPL